MKIGFDVQCIYKEKTGLGCYVSNLISHLKLIDASLKIFLYRWERELNVPMRLWWENVRLKGLIEKDGPDIFHVTGFAGPRRLGSKKVTTVHDLIGMLFPGNLGLFSRYYWSKWLAGCVKNSDFIIADSINTRQDIVRLLAYPRDKIRVIPLAADPSFGYIPDKDACRVMVSNKFGLAEKFILAVGTIEPRKNLSVLIKAYAALDEAARKGHKLVLVGKKGWDFAKIKKLVRDSGLDNRVVFLGYVDNEYLNLLYNCATIFILPSFYEGFGLPLLEAFSCGAPAISSNVSSLPEIAQDNALLFNPWDYKELSLLISRVLESGDLQSELSSKGKKKAEEFSWRKTARETMEVYRSLDAGS